MSHDFESRPAGGEGEAGRISLLVLGILVVAVSLVLVGAAITAVHVQDRRLLACADRVAAYASATISATDYYTRGAGGAVGEPGAAGGLPAPDTAVAHVAASEALALLAGSTCAVGEGVSLDSVEVRDGAVHVGTRTRATLGVVPSVLSGVAMPEVRAESSARTT